VATNAEYNVSFGHKRERLTEGEKADDSETPSSKHASSKASFSSFATSLSCSTNKVDKAFITHLI